MVFSENRLVLEKHKLKYLELNCQGVWSLVLLHYLSHLLIPLSQLYSSLLTSSTHSHLVTTLTHKLNSQISISSSELSVSLATVELPFHSTFPLECSISSSQSLHSKPNTFFLFPTPAPRQKRTCSSFRLLYLDKCQVDQARSVSLPCPISNQLPNPVHFTNLSSPSPPHCPILVLIVSQSKYCEIILTGLSCFQFCCPLICLPPSHHSGFF